MKTWKAILVWASLSTCFGARCFADEKQLVVADGANELRTDGVDLGHPWDVVEQGMQRLMGRLLELATVD